MKKDYSRALFLFMLAALLTAALIRWRLLGLPFERDEGEYAYMGSLILKGLAPYNYAYSMKLPGIYAAYALIMKIFGDTRFAVHGGLLIINFLTSFMVFMLGKKLFGWRAGCLAGASFAILSLNTHLHGVIANSEHFVVFFAVAGVYLLAKATEREDGLAWYFLSGLLLGTAMMMKQHGLLFLLFGPAYIFTLYFIKGRGPVGRPVLRILLLLAGGAVPFMAACLILYLRGGFDKFWFWTFTYSRLYISTPPLWIGLKAFWKKFSPILLTSTAFWALSAGAIAALPWIKAPLEKKLFAMLLLIFSVLAITPGLYFREHYFVLLTPAIAIFAGLAMDSMARFFPRGSRSTLAAILIAAAALTPGLYQERQILLFSTPDEASREIYSMNPFAESVVIAEYIKTHSKAGDTIAVLGSEPQIYFYSRRASATPFIYAYPLMENHGLALKMQKEMIEDIQRARPRFIVYVDIYNSWLRGRDSVGLIFDWFRFYWPGRYRQVGVVEITPRGTRYLWGEDANRAAPESPYSITVFRRKEET